jgi:hypothetical protein
MNNTEVKQAIKYLESHGDGDEGFVKNEHGNYIYSAGPHGVNLPMILADYASESTLRLQKENEELRGALEFANEHLKKGGFGRVHAQKKIESALTTVK